MKPSAGFTLLEVILALGILTSSVYVLSDIQVRAVRRVRRDREQVDRMYLIKKEWVQAFIKEGKADEKPVKKTISSPEVVIQTMRKPLTRFLSQGAPKTGEGKKKAADQPLQMVVSEGAWKSGDYQEKIILVGVRYQPHEKKEKKS